MAMQLPPDTAADRSVECFVLHVHILDIVAQLALHSSLSAGRDADVVIA